MKLKKWKLLDKKDVSPSKYFPLEKKTYELPGGRIVDDFFINTLADSVHVIPITPEGNLIMIRMFKQGVDEFIIQFPAGRIEEKHSGIEDLAVKELEEEAGIKIEKNQLIKVGKFAIAPTKASEYVHFYAVKNISINTEQKFDENEEIEILTFTPSEIDQKIIDGTIYCGPTIAGWHLFKSKFSDLLIST